MLTSQEAANVTVGESCHLKRWHIQSCTAWLRQHLIGKLCTSSAQSGHQNLDCSCQVGTTPFRNLKGIFNCMKPAKRTTFAPGNGDKNIGCTSYCLCEALIGPLNSCVILGKSMSLSESHFSLLYNKVIRESTSLSVKVKWDDILRVLSTAAGMQQSFNKCSPLLLLSLKLIRIIHNKR